MLTTGHIVYSGYTTGPLVYSGYTTGPLVYSGYTTGPLVYSGYTTATCMRIKCVWNKFSKKLGLSLICNIAYIVLVSLSLYNFL